METIKEAFRRNLRRIRKDLKLKQEAMAEKMGVQLSHYRKFEYGETWPSTTKMAEYAAKLGIDPFEFTRPDDPRPQTRFSDLTNPEKQAEVVADLVARKLLEQDQTKVRPEEINILDFLRANPKALELLGFFRDGSTGARDSILKHARAAVRPQKDKVRGTTSSKG